MILRQLFHEKTHSFTYIVACSKSRKAAIIDPVLDNIYGAIKLIEELDLDLRFAIDTHIHADHVTGLGVIKGWSNCQTVMNEHSKAQGLDIKLDGGESLPLGDLEIKSIYTPGHTKDSCCLKVNKHLFTGDTLLIRGTGRTDFDDGDSKAAFASLNTLLELDDDIKIYPGHDYNGFNSSTIGEERKYNTRLQFKNEIEYVVHMGKLNLKIPLNIHRIIDCNLRLGLEK